MSGLWDRPGIPHKGWRCIGCHDLGGPTGICEMCGKESIRYEHYMVHHDYKDTLTCGCVCAEQMENDPLRPKLRESRMKSKAGRRSRWIQRKWRISAGGNAFVNVKGHNIIIFQFKKGASIGKWGYRINRGDEGEFGKEIFETSDEAKLGAFEEFWARISVD
jgi:hypothetical protein